MLWRLGGFCGLGGADRSEARLQGRSSPIRLIEGSACFGGYDFDYIHRLMSERTTARFPYEAHPPTTGNRVVNTTCKRFPSLSINS